MVSKMESTWGLLEPFFLAAIPCLGSKIASEMVSFTVKKYKASNAAGSALRCAIGAGWIALQDPLHALEQH
jgi:hypothetical protein